MVDEHRLADVSGFVERARSAGAEVLAGGGRPAGLAHGHFYAATVVRARPEHEIAREEVFGPVLTVVEADHFEDALAIDPEAESLHAPLAAAYHNTLRLFELEGSFAWHASAAAVGLPDRMR